MLDEGTCSGPDGNPIPLLHYVNQGGPGMLAVSYTESAAVFTTPAWWLDLRVNPVMLSAADKLDLARRLAGSHWGEPCECPRVTVACPTHDPEGYKQELAVDDDYRDAIEPRD